MKKPLILFLLSTVGLGWAWGQEATTLQVAPSDQVIYPDASQILNKEPPKAAAPAPAPKAAADAPKTSAPPTAPAAAVPAKAPALASGKPLVGAVPVSAAQPAAPARPAPGAPADRTHGWFLRWTVTGDEAGVRAWAQGLGREFQVSPAGAGLWEVVSGPLDAAGLSAALHGQAGQAELVKR